MFSKILLASDGSEPAGRAAEVAGDLAKVNNSALVIVHVVNPAEEDGDWRRYANAHAIGFVGPWGGVVGPVGSTGAPFLSREEIEGRRERIGEVAERLLQEAEEIATRKGAGQVTRRVVEGDPAEKILETADQEQADAIVIGSHGYGQIKGLLVGSVSSEVAKKADRVCICVT